MSRSPTAASPPRSPSPATRAGSSVKEPRTSPAWQSLRKGLRKCGCTTTHLGTDRLQIKALQLGLTLVTLVLEDPIDDRVHPLWIIFFKSVSSCALVFCVLIIAIYCTSLYERVGKDRVKQLDFCILLLVGILLLLTSYMFFENYEGESDHTTVFVLGLLAGIVFLVDAIIMCCKCLDDRLQTGREQEMQQENTKRPSKPAEDQPQETQPV